VYKLTDIVLSVYCAMHFSAKCGIAIACCPSVCDDQVPFSHRLEFFEKNFMSE